MPSHQTPTDGGAPQYPEANSFIPVHSTGQTTQQPLDSGHQPVPSEIPFDPAINLSVEQLDQLTEFNPFAYDADFQDIVFAAFPSYIAAHTTPQTSFNFYPHSGMRRDFEGSTEASVYSDTGLHRSSDYPVMPNCNEGIDAPHQVPSYEQFDGSGDDPTFPSNASLKYDDYDQSALEEPPVSPKTNPHSLQSGSYSHSEELPPSHNGRKRTISKVESPQDGYPSMPYPDAPNQGRFNRQYKRQRNQMYQGMPGSSSNSSTGSPFDDNQPAFPSMLLSTSQTGINNQRPMLNTPPRSVPQGGMSRRHDTSFVPPMNQQEDTLLTPTADDAEATTSNALSKEKEEEVATSADTGVEQHPQHSDATTTEEGAAGQLQENDRAFVANCGMYVNDVEEQARGCQTNGRNVYGYAEHPTTPQSADAVQPQACNPHYAFSQPISNAGFLTAPATAANEEKQEDYFSYNAPRRANAPPREPNVEEIDESEVAVGAVTYEPDYDEVRRARERILKERGEQYKKWLSKRQTTTWKGNNGHTRKENGIFKPERIKDATLEEILALAGVDSGSVSVLSGQGCEPGQVFSINPAKNNLTVLVHNPEAGPAKFKTWGKVNPQIPHDLEPYYRALPEWMRPTARSQRSDDKPEESDELNDDDPMKWQLYDRKPEHDPRYSATWVRGEKEEREALCPYNRTCEQGFKAFSLRQSTYNYHMLRCHGIRVDGTSYPLPLVIREVKDEKSGKFVLKGWCPQCERAGDMRRPHKEDGNAWWKHANNCIFSRMDTKTREKEDAKVSW